jgi:phosphodiesterase/alkaline phosphatase D-like protein
MNVLGAVASPRRTVHRASDGAARKGMLVSGFLLKLAVAATAGGLLSPGLAVAQELPPAEKAARVTILQGPSLELARNDWAIIRWTTNNPGGADDHFGVVRYGTDPNALNQVAKSHIRLNRSHSETVFRVSVSGLSPRTTYYYTVASVDSGDRSDEVESSVNRFTTPAPSEQIIAYPPKP